MANEETTFTFTPNQLEILRDAFKIDDYSLIGNPEAHLRLWYRRNNIDRKEFEALVEFLRGGRTR